MREKLSIEEFRKYKEEQQKVAEEVYGKLNTFQDYTNIDQNLFNPLFELQEKLLSYDLSGIPFEEWEDVMIFSSLNKPADFSLTRANLDFYLISTDAFNIPILNENYNFSDCNVKNITYMEGYNDSYFDEKTKQENANIFLSNSFSKELKVKYYNGNLEVKDLINLSPNLIDELKNKDNFLESFKEKDRYLVRNFGIEKNIELYLASPSIYHSVEDLFDLNLYITEFNNDIKISTPDDFKRVIYNKLRNDTMNTEYNNSMFEQSKNILNENNFTKDFVEQNKDLFLKDVDLPEDVKNRYFNRKLTYQDVKNNLEKFRNINIEFFMDKSDNLKELCYRFGIGNFQKALAKYPEIFDHLMANEQLMSDIIKYIPYNYSLQDQDAQYIFGESIKNYYIDYAKKNKIDLLDSKHKFPIWMKSLNINRVISKYNDINELLNYDTNILLLDTKQRSIVHNQNLHFIRNFEKETNFFSRIGVNSFDILNFYQYRTPESYDKFLEELAKILDYERKSGKYSKYPYGSITGEFRDKYPNLFIAENTPPALQEAFYQMKINDEFIKNNKDCLDYIYNSDKEIDDFFNFDQKLVDGIKSNFSKREGYNFIFSYFPYLKDINTNNIDNKNFIDSINASIFNGIVAGSINYNYDAPQQFKEKYPSLFIDENVPAEIKDKFYKGTFTLQDFNDDINLLEYFKNTNIAPALGNSCHWAIPLFEGKEKANYSRLKTIIKYQGIDDFDLQNVFKDYCLKNAIDLKEEKLDVVVEVLDRLLFSNSSELSSLKSQLASQIVNLDNPLEKLDNIEKIFTKNNLPTVGKIYSCFEILHPDFDGFNFTDSMVSPILKHKSNMGREFTVFSDLIRTTFASNNRSVNNYLSNIEIGSNLYENIKNNKTSYNELSEKDKEELSLFSKHLETLYNNTRQGKKEESIITSTNDLEKINNLVIKLSPDGSDNYNIADRVVRMFCGYAGIDTLKEAKNFISNKVGKAELRNTEEAKKDMTLEKGDFIKGIGDITYLGSMLQNGSVSKEYLGADATSDLTPLDTDISMILTDEGTIAEKISKTAAKIYGPIYFVLKNDNRFMITRDSEGEKNLKNDMTKLETFYTGAHGEDHYGIRTGFSSSDINYIVTDSYDKRIGLEIAMNGFYIPVANKEGKITFSRDDYDNLRSKMNGLSYYGMDNYIFSDNLITEKTKEIKTELEGNNAITSAKREKITKKLAESIGKLGLELKDKIDGDLTEGKVELIDTGSTGRGTNKPGDGDFDFMMRLDKSIMLKSNRLTEVKTNILAGLGKEDTNEITGKGDFRLKNVNIGDENIDVDISFVTRTDKINYSTDMALEDRLATIKQLDKEKYQYVVANILLAKQVLKEANVYKPSRSDKDQGGLGGVGIENWILQNGGSFIDASESFLAASKDKSFEEFKQNYQIWDFGENHMPSSTNPYPHDNFVENMNSDGYKKMTSTLKEYINNYVNSETIQK